LLRKKKKKTRALATHGRNLIDRLDLGIEVEGWRWEPHAKSDS
jgi:hypothetical protein